ncbi:MAG: hypothetical protein IJ088_02440 [Clostridia bacterium]|nr:hypothetical protein [Clostridia bacterium]
MRISLNNDIFNEMEDIRDYIFFDGKEWDVKPEAPEEVKKKYYDLRERYRGIRYGE